MSEKDINVSETAEQDEEIKAVEEDIQLEEDDFAPVAQEESTEPETAEDNKDEEAETEETGETNTEAEVQVIENKPEASGDSEAKSEEKENKLKTVLEKIGKTVKSKKFIISASIIAGLLVCAYFGGAIYYKNRFFYGTRIQGYNCSNMTAQEAQKYIENEVRNFDFTIKERGGKTETINGKEIDMEAVSIADAAELKKKQNPLLWVTDRENRHLPLDISIAMNEEKLAIRVGELECVRESRKNMEGATSQIVYQQDNTYSIADDGTNIVSERKIFDKVKAGIYGLYGDMDLEKEGCYVTKAQDDKMQEAIAELNKCVAAKIVYLKGDKSITLDGTTINTWLSLNEDYTVNVNEDKVGEYVSWIAREYNTIGTARDFVTTNGERIKISGGDYGWWVNTGAEKAAVIEIVRSGGVVEREPVYHSKARSHEEFDLGNTYVEISLGAQQLWFYKDGSLYLSSSFVSGDPTKGNGTPTGIYDITYKERNATLKGEDYETPVSYWMPFNGGVGLHDANWRGSFGGSIYRGGGSHGCINLPPSVAKSIFEVIQKGDPVIVY